MPNPKLATLTDAFPGSTLNASNWYVELDSSNSEPSGTVAVSGGTLSLDGGTYSDTGFYCSVNSQDVYDLTSSAAFVRLLPGESGTSDGDSGIAILASNFSDGYNFDVTGGNLQVQKTVSDSPTVLHAVTYNSASMAWLRIRESSGTIYFETAPAATGTWTTQYSTTTETVATWTATSTYIQLFYGSNSGASQPTGTAGYQDFNVAPAETATASLAVTPTLHATASGGTPTRYATAALTVTPSLSAAAALTGLVQETSGHTTGTSLTLTFAKPVTLGNTVIVCIAGYYDGAVSAIALGTSGGSFSHIGGSGGTGGNNAGIYANLGAAQSTATLTVTTSAAGILAWAYEVAGIVYFDQLKGSTGSGTSWSSGATAETVPYPHFVVGLSSVIANSGSITSTGSGWTNESSITNVAGAGGHAIGAVSGYRQPTTSGTYTYSGTSGTSSAWGAVTAAFLVIPRGGNTWGGYIFTEHANYTGVTATFTLPSSVPLASAICSIWVGIGDVYQTGVYLSSSSSYTGNVGTSPWSWWFGGGGGAGELWSTTAFPTGAGDSLSLSLTCDGEFWYATITNNSRDWTYTEVKSVLSNNVGSWAQDGSGNPTTWGWPYPAGTAEVVIEQEGGSPNQLPDYGTINFTGITTTPPVSVLPAIQFTVPTATSGISQYPGPYDISAGSYTMFWNAAE